MLPSFLQSNPPSHTHSLTQPVFTGSCSRVCADARDTAVDKTNTGSILLELRFKEQMKWTILGKYKSSKLNSRRKRKQHNEVDLVGIPTLMQLRG